METMHDWQAQHELDCAMDLVSIAYAVSCRCECRECRALGQWVPVPAPVPAVNLVYCVGCEGWVNGPCRHLPGRWAGSVGDQGRWADI